MSAPKVGDTVRVEVKGKVVYAVDGAIEVRVEGNEPSARAWVTAEMCTALAPPVKVGDKVTWENVGQLPLGTVAAFPSGPVFDRWSNVHVGSDWHATNGLKTDDVVGATVLRIGGTS